MSRLAFLLTAISLTLVATPVLAQTFSDYNGNDTVATREQGNTAAVGQQVGAYGWNNGPPVIGPVVGAVAAPFAVATGGWAEPGCFLYHDFNGRYTSVCGNM
jgi:hypothetical protein